MTDTSDYDRLSRSFRWAIPPRLNMGVDVSDRWAAREPGRPAIIVHQPDGEPEVASFGALWARSTRLATGGAAAGAGQGARVAVLLPQSLEAVVVHVAVYKLGAVAVPLAILFGVDALEYRLKRAAVSVVVTTVAGAERIETIRERLPDLRLVITTDGPGPGAVAWDRLLSAASDRFG